MYLSILPLILAQIRFYALKETASCGRGVADVILEEQRYCDEKTIVS